MEVLQEADSVAVEEAEMVDILAEQPEKLFMELLAEPAAASVVVAALEAAVAVAALLELLLEELDL